MFGIEQYIFEIERHNRRVANDRKETERVAYDFRMMRGPMIEADLDDRLPAQNRDMVEGDL